MLPPHHPSTHFLTPFLASLSEFTHYPHDNSDITIIWHNNSASISFRCFLQYSRGPIQRILINFAKALESGVFEEVFRVNASKYLFCVTVACVRDWDERFMDAVGMA